MRSETRHASSVSQTSPGQTAPWKHCRRCLQLQSDHPLRRAVLYSSSASPIGGLRSLAVCCAEATTRRLVRCEDSREDNLSSSQACDLKVCLHTFFAGSKSTCADDGHFRHCVTAERFRLRGRRMKPMQASWACLLTLLFVPSGILSQYLNGTQRMLTQTMQPEVPFALARDPPGGSGQLNKPCS